MKSWLVIAFSFFTTDSMKFICRNFLTLNLCVLLSLRSLYSLTLCIPNQSPFVKCSGFCFGVCCCFVVFVFALLVCVLLSAFLVFLPPFPQLGPVETKNCVSCSIFHTVFMTCLPSLGLANAYFQSTFNLRKKQGQSVQF